MSAQNSDDTLQVVGLAVSPIIGRVWHLADPLCRSEGLELVHVEYQREPGGRTLRLYLDKPGGVTLDDCAAVSRQLGDILDVNLDTQVPYRLEVSSPGLKRPLGKLEDFKRFCGRSAKIRTRQAINGQKNFTGKLVSVVQSEISLQTNEKAVRIALANIAKAQLLDLDGD